MMKTTSSPPDPSRPAPAPVASDFIFYPLLPPSGPSYWIILQSSSLKYLDGSFMSFSQMSSFPWGLLRSHLQFKTANHPLPWHFPNPFLALFPSTGLFTTYAIAGNRAAWYPPFGQLASSVQSLTVYYLFFNLTSGHL